MSTSPPTPPVTPPSAPGDLDELEQLMRIFSVPRPNGSSAEAETSRRIQAWLARRGIPCRVETFRRYPYFFECLGLWLVILPVVLAASVWWQFGWPSLVLAMITLVGGTLDLAFHVPLVTWPGAGRGENIFIDTEPGSASGVGVGVGVGVGGRDDASMPEDRPELILSAHYDSKTELFDHRRRTTLARALPVAAGLIVILGVSGPLHGSLLAQSSSWAPDLRGLAAALCVPMLALTVPLGLGLALGRLGRQSQGAVDDGAACAILLGLAHRLARGEVAHPGTRVTIALFTGEEVNLQGSRAYSRSRWPRANALSSRGAVAAVNLELMAQDGPYVHWQTDGSVFRQQPTSDPLNRLLGEVVSDVTGEAIRPAGPIVSDAASFLARGVPAAVLGTHHRLLGDRGLHRPADRLERVHPVRLLEGMAVLEALLRRPNHLFPALVPASRKSDVSGHPPIPG